MDEMKQIVLCKYCGKPEYYGEERWLSGKCMCRSCYKAAYQDERHELYTWSDLDGHVPTMEEYLKQQEELRNE